MWPNSDILTVQIDFFLRSSSGFLRTLWEFSIQIPEKFSGKYQIVQLSSGGAVERQRCNSEVCRKNLSICGYFEPFEHFQSLPDPWISSDCLKDWLVHPPATISLFLGAPGWGFHPFLFSPTDCRPGPLRKCLNEVFGPSSSMPGQRQLKPEENPLICTKAWGSILIFRICRLP